MESFLHYNITGDNHMLSFNHNCSIVDVAVLCRIEGPFLGKNFGKTEVRDREVTSQFGCPYTD